MKKIEAIKPTQRRMIFCRCTIFRLAKPAFFRYNENFTLGRDFYVACFVIPEISKTNWQCKLGISIRSKNNEITSQNVTILTAKKKCEDCHSSHWNYQKKLKRSNFFPKFQRWMKKTNIFNCNNLVLSNELIKVELPPWKLKNEFLLEIFAAFCVPVV